MEGEQRAPPPRSSGPYREGSWPAPRRSPPIAGMPCGAPGLGRPRARRCRAGMRCGMGCGRGASRCPARTPGIFSGCGRSCAPRSARATRARSCSRRPRCTRPGGCGAPGGRRPSFSIAPGVWTGCSPSRASCWPSSATRPRPTARSIARSRSWSKGERSKTWFATKEANFRAPRRGRTPWRAWRLGGSLRAVGSCGKPRKTRKNRRETRPIRRNRRSIRAQAAGATAASAACRSSCSKRASVSCSIRSMVSRVSRRNTSKIARRVSPASTR